MFFLQIIEPCFGFGLLLFFCVFYLQRARARRHEPGARFSPGYGSMGNAFQALQVMAQPEVQYVLEEKQQEDAEDDDEGDPDDPAKALQKQLRRIRNGEEIDRLRIRLR